MQKIRKVLYIANSFGVDSTKYLPAVARDVGVTDLTVGCLLIGGCRLSRHAKNLAQDIPDYVYYKSADSGDYEVRENTVLRDAILDEKWDAIGFQQQSSDAGNYATYEPHLTDLLNGVRALCPDAVFFWNFTWAYPDGSTSPNFAPFGNDRVTMFRTLRSVWREHIAQDTRFLFSVPTGTAVEYGRAALGNVLNRDAIHLNMRGRYLAALLHFTVLTGISPEAEKLVTLPEEVSKEELPTLVGAVRAAISDPFGDQLIKVKNMKKRSAAVFILLGQSNAVGHGIPMKEEDKIRKPLTRVFGLSREENQTLHPEKLTFSGYLSAGMNLAETQDDTYSLANCLAKRWEAYALLHDDFPDLYIVQIAIGAQGVGPSRVLHPPFYMWNPAYPETLVPGPLGTVDISLFPFTERILSLLPSTFASLGVPFDVLGVHFRGGENDAVAGMPDEVIPDVRPVYEQLFAMFERSLGKMPKTVLYQIMFGGKNDLREDDVNLDFVHATTPAINAMFEEFAAKYPEISTYDPKTHPFYHENEPMTLGLFLPTDGVHYTPEANDAIAADILREALEKYGE